MNWVKLAISLVLMGVTIGAQNTGTCTAGDHCCGLKGLDLSSCAEQAQWEDSVWADNDDMADYLRAVNSSVVQCNRKPKCKKIMGRCRQSCLPGEYIYGSEACHGSSCVCCVRDGIPDHRCKYMNGTCVLKTVPVNPMAEKLVWHACRNTQYSCRVPRVVANTTAVITSCCSLPYHSDAYYECCDQYNSCLECPGCVYNGTLYGEGALMLDDRTNCFRLFCAVDNITGQHHTSVQEFQSCCFYKNVMYGNGFNLAELGICLSIMCTGNNVWNVTSGLTLATCSSMSIALSSAYPAMGTLDGTTYAGFVPNPACRYPLIQKGSDIAPSWYVDTIFNNTNPVTSKVLFNFGGGMYTCSSSIQTRCDGTLPQLSAANNAYESPLNSGNFYYYNTGIPASSLSLFYTSFNGITIQVKKTLIAFKVPKSLKTLVGGLCGSFNTIPITSGTGNLAKRDGTVASTYADFAASWAKCGARGQTNQISQVDCSALNATTLAAVTYKCTGQVQEIIGTVAKPIHVQEVLNLCMTINCGCQSIECDEANILNTMIDLYSNLKWTLTLAEIKEIMASDYSQIHD